MKQTAIDWYFDKIKSHFEHDGDLLETATFTYAIAKQKEKQQILDAFQYGVTEGTLTNINYLKCESEANHYYNETYGSKGSDEHIVDTNETIEQQSKDIALQNQSESKAIPELSNESWEGCDGCTEQDEVMYKNGYVKGYNAAKDVVLGYKTSLDAQMLDSQLPQTEISDSTITDQIDGIIFQLPFDDKIKLWELIDKLVEENRTEISDEEIENEAEKITNIGNRREYWKQGIKWYREQLKNRNQK